MPAVSQLLRVLRSQLYTVERGGPHGDDGNITAYGKAYRLNGVAWCAIFVWWCFKQIGIDLRELVTKYFAGTVPAVDAWRRHGWFHDGTRGIRPGDIAYFDFPGGDRVDHTGVVEKVDRDGIHTIEGNTTPGAEISDPNGGGVYPRLRPPAQFVGYARVPGLRYDLKARARHAAAKAKARVKRYPTLQLGDRGKKVERLQNLLIQRGYLAPMVDHRWSDDGVFGPNTDAAVRAFQRDHHLHVDGVAGPKTLAAIRF